MGRWEQGQATEEEFRNVAQAHSDCVRKAKAQLEPKVQRDIKGNKASFCHCMSSKGINKENVDLLLNRTGDSVTMDTDEKSSEPSFPQFSPGSLGDLNRQANHKLAVCP